MQRKKAGKKEVTKYSVIVKHEGQEEALDFFMGNFEKMLKKEFQEYGKVTVIKEASLQDI